MKGIILHGGHGTRLRPLTHTGPKQLLPIANKTMSQYALEDLRDSGITDIVIIIGGSNSEKVKEYYGDGKKFGVNICYVFQDQPKGIAHAIGLCKDFVKDDKFVVYLGDNILRNGLENYVQEFEKSKAEALILLSKVEDPSRFGVAEFENNKITKIVEKPKNPKSNFAVIGNYFLTPKIFDIISKLKPSLRGELEITEALDILMNEGLPIDHRVVSGWWKDTGTPEDILHANELVLETIGTDHQLVKKDDMRIQGKNILIGNNSIITRDCFIEGPVIIGKNCTIGPSVRLGPYVSIGENSVLRRCDIKNSIVMENCKLDTKIDITDSIVASGSTIINNIEPRRHQFLLGERSQIKL